MNTGSTVFEQFSVVVHPPAAWGNDLNDPVRCTCAAFVCEFARITYNAYIWLDIYYHLHSKIRKTVQYRPYRGRLSYRCSQQSCDRGCQVSADAYAWTAISYTSGRQSAPLAVHPAGYRYHQWYTICSAAGMA